MTKLNDGPTISNNHQEGTQVRKALRATLILFPLLGITNLLFFINPKNGTHDKIYVIFNATMQSSQVKLLNYIIDWWINERVFGIHERRSFLDDRRLNAEISPKWTQIWTWSFQFDVNGDSNLLVSTTHLIQCTQRQSKQLSLKTILQNRSPLRI